MKLKKCGNNTRTRSRSTRKEKINIKKDSKIRMDRKNPVEKTKGHLLLGGFNMKQNISSL